MRLIRILKTDMCREAADWVGEGIISATQAEAICARYGVDYHNLGRRNFGYQVLVGFGCLFIGLSVITLLGANWDEIPRAVRMAGLILLTLAANAAGLRFHHRGHANKAVIGFFLGGLLYGASIMLIAQIYHIGEHFPDGIFWWAAGVLPAALLLESTLLMMLTVVLAFLWFFVESGLQFYPALFPVFLAALFWHVFRVRQSKILFLVLVAGVCLWAEYSLAWWMGEGFDFRPGAENVVLGIGLFVLLAGLSKWLLVRRDHQWADNGILLGLWVLRFVIVTLFVFSFKQPWQALIETKWAMPAPTVGMAIVLSAAGVWLAHRSPSKIFSTLSFAVLFNIGLLAVMLAENPNFAVGFQFADNILVVSVGIRLIVRGIQENITHYFYVGVMALLATGLLRYIDLVGDYVGASILFAVLAAILLLAARYWKNHQAKIGTSP